MAKDGCGSLLFSKNLAIVGTCEAIAEAGSWKDGLLSAVISPELVTVLGSGMSRRKGDYLKEILDSRLGRKPLKKESEV